MFGVADIWFKNFHPKTEQFFSISLNAVYEKLVGGGEGKRKRRGIALFKPLHDAVGIIARDLPMFLTPGSASLIEFIEAVLICTITECDSKTLHLNSIPLPASCFQTAEYEGETNCLPLSNCRIWWHRSICLTLLA